MEVSSDLLNRYIDQIVDDNDTFIVKNEIESFKATVVKQTEAATHERYKILKGGKINIECDGDESELVNGHSEAELVIKFVDEKTGELTDDLPFMHLATAVRHASFYRDWAKVTYIPDCNDSIYVLALSKTLEQNGAENADDDISRGSEVVDADENVEITDESLSDHTAEIDTVENAENTLDEANETAESEASFENELIEHMTGLVQSIVKICGKSKTVELSDRSVDKLAKAIKPSEVFNGDITISKETIKDISSLINKDDITDDEELEFIEDEVAFDKYKTGIVGRDFSELENRLHNGKKAVLIEGVPGTGKTTFASEFLKRMEANGHKTYTFSMKASTGHIEMIGGHTFVNNKFVFKYGLLPLIWYEASRNKNINYYILLDEITRCPISAVLGEAITAMTFRGRAVYLSSGRKIVIPNNVYFIATANIIDSSAKDMDMAVYQRFDKMRLDPQWTNEYMEAICYDTDTLELLCSVAEDMRELNEAILDEPTLGRDRLIGTRDITIANPTIENVVHAIRNELINSIKRCGANQFTKIKTKVSNTIASLEDKCDAYTQ